MTKFLYNIKLTVWLFLLGEFLDGVTTAIGLYVGGREGNELAYGLGWTGLILLKIAVCLLVSWFIQYRIQHKWMEWMLVIAGSIIVPWNIFMIIYYSLLV